MCGVQPCGFPYHPGMSLLLAMALVVSTAAKAAPSAVVSSDGLAVLSTIELEDPAFSASLLGATLLVERKDGVFLQGAVAEASVNRLVIETDEIHPGEAKKIRTLQPAGAPLRAGMEVRVLTAGGAMVRGAVLDVSGRQVSIGVAEGTVRLRWLDMARLEIVAPPRAATFAKTPAPDVASRYIVKLKDGSALRGEIVARTRDSLTVQTSFGLAAIPVERIDRVEVDLEAFDAADASVADVVALGLTPTAIFQPHPAYPTLARRTNLQGTVSLEIVVDASGNVATVRVVQSQPPFDLAALSAVRQWRYAPLLVNGTPTAWKSRVNLNFRLGGNEIAASGVAATAPPKRFGSVGTWEGGGGVGYGSAKRHENFQGTTYNSSGTDFFVSPFAGYFVKDGVELSGGMTLDLRTSGYFDGSGRSDGYLAAFASGGYYFAAGDSARVGPELTLRLVHEDIEDKSADGVTSTKFTEEGPGFVLSVLAKAPLTKGCLLTGGIGWFRDNRSLSARQGPAQGRGSSVITGVQTTVRFSVWF